MGNLRQLPRIADRVHVGSPSSAPDFAADFGPTSRCPSARRIRSCQPDRDPVSTTLWERCVTSASPSS